MAVIAPNFATVSLFLNMALLLVLSGTYRVEKPCSFKDKKGVSLASEGAVFQSGYEVPSSALNQEAQPWYPGQPNPLREWFDDYSRGPVVHKWLHYFDIYHRHLARFRGKNATIVEFGVQSGGSVKMWKWYFGEGSTIFGIDINSKCRQFEEEGVHIIIGDEGDRNFLESLKKTIGGIDVLIEDGSHVPKDQIAVFEVLYPAVQPHGVYLVEDLHTAYMFEYAGGLRRPGTMIEYIKDLLDDLHAWYYQEKPRNTSTFHTTTNNMHLYDSVMLIEKVPTQKPTHVRHGTIEIPYE